jgi:hypothetical protein
MKFGNIIASVLFRQNLNNTHIKNNNMEAVLYKKAFYLCANF